jgi:hypothetical protein
MYEPPISLFEYDFLDNINNSIDSQIKKMWQAEQKHKEEQIYQTIKKYYVDVDKEELVRALSYDRDQYNKGYKDGFVEGAKAFFERLQEAFYNDVVSVMTMDNILKEIEDKHNEII